VGVSIYHQSWPGGGDPNASEEEGSQEDHCQEVDQEEEEVVLTPGEPVPTNVVTGPAKRSSRPGTFRDPADPL
jgi:hypothetical protein